MHKYLHICKEHMFIIFNSIIFILLIYSSILYAKHNKLFSQEKVVVLGNKFVKQGIILDAMNLSLNESIFSYNLGELKNNIELIEFVKSVKISRILPSTLMVQIIERSPIILVLYT